jgi:ABC-type nitrate/sulfonate/bicarbonate transport system substrate-binding protein
MKKFSTCLLWSLAVWLLLSVPVTAQTLRIGTLGLSGQLLPLWVAQDRGIFAQYGFKTEVITFQGGVPAIQALLAGEIQFAATGGAPGVNAKLSGADIIAIAEWINTIPYMLVVRQDIDKLDRLKGKKIAISRFGSLAHYAVRLTLSGAGLNPEKDVQILQVGNESVRLTALMQKTVDATILTPPTNLVARNMGFRVLASLQELGIKYSFDHIFVLKDYATRNRDNVIRFLKAFLHGIAYMKSHRSESVESLRKWLRLNDQEALEESYRIFVEIIPARPRGSEEGWKNLLDSIGSPNPKVKSLESKDLFDYSFLNEIERSGFIDGLYK